MLLPDISCNFLISEIQCHQNDATTNVKFKLKPFVDDHFTTNWTNNLGTFPGLRISKSYTMACPPVRRDVDKHDITILSTSV